MSTPAITALLRQQIGNPPTKGAMTHVVRAFEGVVAPPTVYRWFKGTRPDPRHWQLLERVLKLPPGAIHAADQHLTRLVPPADDELEVLRVQVAALSEQVTELARVVAAQGAAAGRGRRATGRGSPG